MKQRFRVGGMSCAACSAHVEKSVGAVPGVTTVQVNLLAGSMAVEYDETACDSAKIIAAVESMTASSRLHPRRASRWTRRCTR